MQNQELLQKLEQIHRLTAQIILDLRDLTRNADRYTQQEKDRMQDRVKERLGTKLVLSDELPNYREFAVTDID